MPLRTTPWWVPFVVPKQVANRTPDTSRCAKPPFGPHHDIFDFYGRTVPHCHDNPPGFGVRLASAALEGKRRRDDLAPGTVRLPPARRKRWRPTALQDATATSDPATTVQVSCQRPNDLAVALKIQ